ncbi:hypothetical protein [Butyrivibrio sp. INlla21]|uniref:hypothetical protein n=1 Tax=Butyrivibrio sp. INlla21 TaxID=1520811 RepID=UPI0008EB274A|nr:hypothetical protein [Butyrivibrio sp. INlla21]SFU85874.1 hypothetical protein SAMN02910342_02076 [Butyrivibrio sp. INlla21]
MRNQIRKWRRNILILSLLGAMLATAGCSEMDIESEFGSAVEATSENSEPGIPIPTKESSAAESSVEDEEHDEDASASASSSESIKDEASASAASSVTTDGAQTPPNKTQEQTPAVKETSASWEQGVPTPAPKPTQDVKPTPSGGEQAQAPADNAQVSGDQNLASAGIAVGCETAAGDGSNVTQLYSYEYPKFSCMNPDYNKVVGELNEIFENEKNKDLADNANVAYYSQKVNSVSIDEQAQYVYINVSRIQEVGGPHPNVYEESYFISKDTKDFTKLSDVQGLTEAQIQDAADQIYSAHNDKDYFVITEEVKKAIKSDNVHWRYEGDNLYLWLDYDQITGGYHGDSEYSAIIAL